MATPTPLPPIVLALTILAASLVLVAIAVSLATAVDIGRLRATLAALDRQLLAAEDQLEQIAAQRRTADGTLGLHKALRDEKTVKLKQLTEELEWLKEDRVQEREIKVSGTRSPRSAADASVQE